MLLLQYLLIFLLDFFQNNFKVPVYFEGTISFQSDTLDYTGKKVVFKAGTKFILNDTKYDDKPINFVIIADSFEIQGELTLEGIGEPGKPGIDGRDCFNCRKSRDKPLIINDRREFENKCNSELPSNYIGEQGQKGGKGGSGAIVYFYYQRSYTGLSNMKINLYGGKGGKPGKGGANRLLQYIDPENSNEVKECKGGKAGNLGYGETGASGSFNLRKVGE